MHIDNKYLVITYLYRFTFGIIFVKYMTGQKNASNKLKSASIISLTIFKKNIQKKKK